MTRDELERKIGHHVAFAMTGNRMPDMSGDARNRLSPMQRRNCDHAVEAIIDHPRIARALTLLDRIGEHAADALIAGTATVVATDLSGWFKSQGDELSADWGGINSVISAGRLDRGGA